MTKEQFNNTLEALKQKIKKLEVANNITPLVDDIKAEKIQSTLNDTMNLLIELQEQDKEVLHHLSKAQIVTLNTALAYKVTLKIMHEAPKDGFYDTNNLAVVISILSVNSEKSELDYNNSFKLTYDTLFNLADFTLSDTVYNLARLAN